MEQSMLVDATIGAVLRQQAQRLPDKPFIVCGGERLSFAEVDAAADALAAALQERGIQKGDPVAVLLPNGAPFVIALFAAARLGAPFVPLNTRYRDHELDFMLNNCRASVLITAAGYGGFDYLALLREVQPRLRHLRHIIATEAGAGAEHLGQILAQYADQRPQEPALTQSDIAAILYTSGTTGQPKGAMLTHSNIVRNGQAMADGLRWTEDDVLAVFVPMFHVFGITPSIMAATLQGSTMAILETYNPEAALGLIQRERISIHHGVPTMFILELNHPRFKEFDLSSLRTGIIAAAPCPVEIVRRIRDEMGCNICVAYGLTETSPCLTLTKFNDPDELRSETVGLTLPGVEIKIVDDERREVPTRQVGELAARGYPIMAGYFEQPQATTEAIDRDGWFYTGDLATIDEFGYVRIVGRKKEMIVRGGFKVYPRELEELYYTHPAVQEVAIVGVPDPVLGERSVACVRLKNGAHATAEELVDFVRDHVADYKVPDRVLFVDSFPMTASGKIRKVELAKMLAEERTIHQ